MIAAIIAYILIRLYNMSPYHLCQYPPQLQPPLLESRLASTAVLELQQRKWASVNCLRQKPRSETRRCARALRTITVPACGTLNDRQLRYSPLSVPPWPRQA